MTPVRNWPKARGIQMEGGWMTDKVQDQSKLKHYSEHLFHVCISVGGAAGTIFQKMLVSDERKVPLICSEKL